jgi:hypothetical protein
LGISNDLKVNMKVNRVNKVNILPFKLRVFGLGRSRDLSFPRRTPENALLKVNRLTTRVNIGDS